MSELSTGPPPPQGSQSQAQSQQPRSARTGRARSHAEELSPVVASLSQLAGSTGLAQFLWGPSPDAAEGQGQASTPRTHATDAAAGGGGKPAAVGEGAAVTGGGVSPGVGSPGAAGLPQPGRQPGARFALLILTCINLLNYIDRYVPSAVKELIKEDLKLTDAQTAYPLTGMILVYMVFSPLFGWISDHRLVGRRPLLAAAILFWSAATALAALSNNLASLVGLRSLVGVGEAAYVVIATPMIADFFPSKERNVALGVFYLAIPLGAAMGYAVGGILGETMGWRKAFLFCGVPGLVVAFLVLLIQDPPRGINDEPAPEHAAMTEAEALAATRAKGQWDDYKTIFTNPYFMYGLAGVTANCFCLGALADWMPTFLSRYRGLSLQNAGFVIGVATVLGGIGGLFLGASVADLYKRRGLRNAYLLVSAALALPGAALMWASINVQSSVWTSVLITLSEIFIWTFNSPISSLMVNSLRPELRARGTGAQIFIQHILGDVISPPIIGAVSDATGSLATAINILPAFIVLSALVWAWAGWRLPELPAMLKRQRSARHEEGVGEEWEYVHDDEHVSFFKVLCAREPKRTTGANSQAAAAAAEEAAALGLDIGGRESTMALVMAAEEEETGQGGVALVSR